MTRKLESKDLPQLVREVVKLAETYPKNVYTRSGQFCGYTTGHNSHCPEKGCIFGRGMVNMGIDPSQYQHGKGESYDMNHIIQAIVDREYYEGTAIKNIRDFQEYCSMVQGKQDFGSKWEDCICRDELENLGI